MRLIVPWAAAPVLSEIVEESAMAAILQEPMKKIREILQHILEELV